MANPPAKAPAPLHVANDETGVVGTLPPEFALQAANAGLRPATHGDVARAQARADTAATEAAKEAELGSAGNIAGSTIAGAARGLTLGGSDYLAGKFGPPELKQRLLDYQKYNPIASSVGELGAIGGAALLGDEAGALTLPGALGRLGTGLGGRITAGLGGKVAARVIGGAASGAAEAALYEAGKKTGDLSLRDEKITAEKVASAAGHAALFGAPVGGVLGLFGKSAVAATAAKKEASEVAGAEAGGMAATAKKDASEVADAEAAGVAPRAADAAASTESRSVGDWLQHQSDVNTFKSFGGTARDIEAVERSVPGGIGRVARDVRAGLKEETGSSIGLHSRESMNAVAARKEAEYGAKIGGMLRKLDEDGAMAPDAQRFAKKVEETIVSKLMRTNPDGTQVPIPFAADTVKAVRKVTDELTAAYEKSPATFADWHKARIDLDKSINFAKRAASPSEEALKEVRGLMETELKTAGDAAAQMKGQAWSDQYQAAKSLYQSFRIARELTEHGIAAQTRNNSFGIGSMLYGAAGVATGGPVGGIIGGLAGKVVKDHADQLAADLFSRLANIAGVSKLVARSDASVTEGVASLVGTKAASNGLPSSGVRLKSAAPMGVTLTGNKRSDFNKVANAVNDMASNPAKTTERVGAALGPDAGQHPKLAGALATLAVGDAAWLQSKLPSPRADQYSLQPQFDRISRASDSEISTYMRKAEALANPLIVLDEAKKGTLTRDHVEAIKERRPGLYKQIQTEVMTSLAASKKPLSYQDKIQLGILLDLPTDKTLSPEFLREIQATYAVSGKAGAESPPPTLSRPVDVAEASQTALERAQSGLGR